MPAPPHSHRAVLRSTTRSRGNPWIRVAGSAIHGRGIYARVEIPDGTRIIDYRGERISKSESTKRENQRLARLARGGDGCVYIFTLNQRYDLDGRTRGNVAKFINHSCNPNCRAEIINGRVWIVARREIPAGAELSFDYGFSYREWRLHPCRCGARGCPGYIVNAPQRWLVRRALRADAKSARETAKRAKAATAKRRGPR
jgi:SET domain-containing protein